MRIRNQKLINNILFDNLVIDYIQRYDPEDMEEYK